MKKNLIKLFALIGVLLLTTKIVGFIRVENRTRGYWENCEKVEIGMTLNQAREIIGDLKYKSWTQDSYSGEIIISEYKNTLNYSLEYPMVFAGSDNMRLEFDPSTLLITNKFCGE